MRALFVGRLLAAALLPLALGASPPVVLHAGDHVTDRDVFAYLALPVTPGAWVRYRVRFADRSTIEKTIGFGEENVDGRPTLFIETHVAAQGVSGVPGTTAVPIGMDAVLKTYVAGSAFGDLATAYEVVTSAVRIGAFEYEVTPGVHQTFSALTGAQDDEPRHGTVRSLEAVDVRVAGRVAHCTHIVASFAAAPLPAGGVQEPYMLEVWQSPDVPLGTVLVLSGAGRSIDWRLAAYGTGYRSLFAKTLDAIRRSAHPSM